MIKYSKLDGYKNMGEIYPFAHIYQFIEAEKDNPMIILIHAYECKAKVFKGYMFHSTKTYQSIPLNDDEIKAIEPLVGKAEQIDFDKLISGTTLEEVYKEYTYKKYTSI